MVAKISGPGSVYTWVPILHFDVIAHKASRLLVETVVNKKLHVFYDKINDLVNFKSPLLLDV